MGDLPCFADKLVNEEDRCRSNKISALVVVEKENEAIDTSVSLCNRKDA